MKEKGEANIHPANSDREIVTRRAELELQREDKDRLLLDYIASHDGPSLEELKNAGIYSYVTTWKRLWEFHGERLITIVRDRSNRKKFRVYINDDRTPVTLFLEDLNDFGRAYLMLVKEIKIKLHQMKEMGASENNIQDLIALLIYTIEIFYLKSDIMNHISRATLSKISYSVAETLYANVFMKLAELHGYLVKECEEISKDLAVILPHYAPAVALRQRLDRIMAVQKGYEQFGLGKRASQVIEFLDKGLLDAFEEKALIGSTYLLAGRKMPDSFLIPHEGGTSRPIPEEILKKHLKRKQRPATSAINQRSDKRDNSIAEIDELIIDEDGKQEWTTRLVSPKSRKQRRKK